MKPKHNYDEEFKRNSVELYRSSNRGHWNHVPGIRHSPRNTQTMGHERPGRQKVDGKHRAIPGTLRQRRAARNRETTKRALCGQPAKGHLKKSLGHRESTGGKRMAMIRQLHEDGYTMAELAIALKIPRSSLYARMNREEVVDKQYSDHIETTIARQARQYRCTYGVKRLRHVLRRTVGLKTSERKIRRILDKYQLRAVAKRPFKPRTTESDPHLRPSPNLLEKEGLPQNKNQQWVSDITYIKTREGWSYLCAFMDRYSRRILGWSLAKNMTSRLVEEAFRKSLKRRGFDKQPGLIVHSDRGSQYSSKSFRRMLREAGCLQSMSPRGDCYANAHAESLWSTIKTEGFTQVLHSHQQAKLVLFDYVETFYNSRRHHSSLGWLNPIDFELTSFNHL